MRRVIGSALSALTHARPPRLRTWTGAAPPPPPPWFTRLRALFPGPPDPRVVADSAGGDPLDPDDAAVLDVARRDRSTLVDLASAAAQRQP